MGTFPNDDSGMGRPVFIGCPFEANVVIPIPPADKQAKLDAIAANARRSRSYTVNEAIDHYLDLYEWQTRRIEERLERTQSGDAGWTPHDEVFDRLEAKIRDRIECGQS